MGKAAVGDNPEGLPFAPSMIRPSNTEGLPTAPKMMEPK